MYVSYLTHYEEKTKRLLTVFDRRLETLSEEIYRLIGSRETSSFMGFEYINYWRRHKDANPVVIKMLSKVYMRLLKLKQMSRKPDEMAIPIPD